MGTERVWRGRGRGRGRGGSRVGRLNDSHVTKPSRTVCVCVCYALVFLPFITFCSILVYNLQHVSNLIQSTRQLQRRGGRGRERASERERDLGLPRSLNTRAPQYTSYLVHILFQLKHAVWDCGSHKSLRRRSAAQQNEVKIAGEFCLERERCF